jgi:hypothetical protein
MSTESFMNEYEQTRLENIKRNQAKLAEIFPEIPIRNQEEEELEEEDEMERELDRIFDSLFKKNEIPSNKLESSHLCTCCFKKTSTEYFHGPMGFNTLCLECSIEFYHGNLNLNEKGKKIK